MSLDTSFADPISTLSPWEQLRSRLFAEREIAADALRRELDAQLATERTAAHVQADVTRYAAWLKLPAVRRSARWYADVDQRLQAVTAELALMGGAL